MDHGLMWTEKSPALGGGWGYPGHHPATAVLTPGYPGTSLDLDDLYHARPRGYHIFFFYILAIYFSEGVQIGQKTGLSGGLCVDIPS
jgi:hypothetical protein